MSLLSDIAADYTYVEGVETVSLVSQNPTGAEVRNVKALRKSINPRALRNLSVFGVDSQDESWHLWSATLQGVKPKNGDEIKDSNGKRWRIKTVSHSIRSGRFICMATPFE